MEEKISIILDKITAIENKLDRVIKALQEYDGVDEDLKEPYDEYAWENINSAAAERYNEVHDQASWEEESNKTMDIIGQNSNKDLHYEDKPKPKRRYYKPKKKK